MKVSVSVITYNHAPFIRQTIESVLAQKTNFDFEIVIGEDGSTDGTREIVQDLQAAYPKRIRLLLHDRKNVIYVNGDPTGQWNFRNNLRNTRGEYIALLDGDDYWTSPDKLQKQVDYLDAHPEHSMCFHDVNVIYQDGSPSHLYPLQARKPVYSVADLLAGDVVPATCSVMLRRKLFHDFPEWYNQLMFADLPLFVLTAAQGDFGFLEEPLGAYRVHQGGLWTQGSMGGRSWPKAVAKKRYTSFITFCEAINAHFQYRYQDILAPRIAHFAYDLAWYYQAEEDWPKMRHYLVKALRHKALHPKVPRTYIAKGIAIAFLPWAYRAFRQMKSALRPRKAPTASPDKNLKTV